MNRRHQRSRSFSEVWKIMFLISLSVGVMAEAQEVSSQIPLENRVKAAFLIKFFSFVDWPPDALPAGGDDVVIGVVGQGPTLSALVNLQGVKVADDRRLVVQRLTRARDFGSCHIVFFSEDPGVDVGQVIGEIADTAVLTVGVTGDFINLGGMVRLFVDASKIRFEINPEACRSAGLKVSSHLLRLAEITDTSEDR